MNFPETNERALQRGPQANPSPTGHPPVSHPFRPNGKKGSELSSRENSKAVSHFILKIHTKFEFHSTGYEHLFCCDNFNIIGLNYLSLSKIISSCGLCTLNIPLLFEEYLFGKFGFPGGSAVKNSSASAGDTGEAGLIPG